MSTEFDELIAGLNVEDVSDAAEGVHPDAVFLGASVGENGRVTVKFKVQDKQGEEREVGDSFQILTEKIAAIQSVRGQTLARNVVLQWEHRLGIVPVQSKSVATAPDAEHAEQLVRAFNTRVGKTVPIIVSLDPASGFLRVRPSTIYAKEER